MCVEKFYCLLTDCEKSRRWGTGRGVTVHRSLQWKREKQLAEKRDRISSSHSLRTFMPGDAEVSVDNQTGQAVM